MGILSRFRDIMASNINALLDKADDPEKTINDYMRLLNNDLGQVASHEMIGNLQKYQQVTMTDSIASGILIHLHRLKQSVHPLLQLPLILAKA